VVTVTGPVEFPIAPMVQVICVLVALVTVQATPLMVTVIPEMAVGKLVPVMVRGLPGAVLAGLKPLMVGAEPLPPFPLAL
jgi:hypothetical protein